MSHPIQPLIKRFENQIDIYKRDDYNEAQTRSDFSTTPKGFSG